MYYNQVHNLDLVEAIKQQNMNQNFEKKFIGKRDQCLCHTIVKDLYKVIKWEECFREAACRSLNMQQVEAYETAVEYISIVMTGMCLH